MSAAKRAAKKIPGVRCLLVDVGGVLMSNGWDHEARTRAAASFDLDPADLENRNHLVAGLYEEGRCSLDEYLDQTVFYRRRPFTRERFRSFMLGQSKPYPDMLALLARLKARHGLRVAVLSNEGRELNAHRVQLARLDNLADVFISSSFLGMRKPDPAFYRLALDLVQVPVQRVLYLENTELFVRAAARLGLRGLLHKDCASTKAALAGLGLD